MIHMRKLPLFAATFLFALAAVCPALAAEPPANLCSLLPAADVSKALGHAYADPQKTVAPRPYANTNTGTDCNYFSKDGGKLWFRAYVDPSASAASDLFTKLSMWYGTPTPVKGVGDEAYFDKEHAIHVRKGKVRYYLNLSSSENSAAKEKQLTELAKEVAGKL
jgi:hypothetical protein